MIQYQTATATRWATSVSSNREESSTGVSTTSTTSTQPNGDSGQFGRGTVRTVESGSTGSTMYSPTGASASLSSTYSETSSRYYTASNSETGTNFNASVTYSEQEIYSLTGTTSSSTTQDSVGLTTNYASGHTYLQSFVQSSSGATTWIYGTSEDTVTTSFIEPGSTGQTTAYTSSSSSAKAQVTYNESGTTSVSAVKNVTGVSTETITEIIITSSTQSATTATQNSSTTGTATTSLPTTAFSYPTSTQLAESYTTESTTKMGTTTTATQTMPNGAALDLATVFLAEPGEALVIVTASGASEASALCVSGTATTLGPSRVTLESVAPSTNATGNWTITTSGTGFTIGTTLSAQRSTATLTGRGWAQREIPTPTTTLQNVIITGWNISSSESSSSFSGTVLNRLTVATTISRSTTSTSRTLVESAGALVPLVFSTRVSTSIAATKTASAVTNRPGLTMGSTSSWTTAASDVSVVGPHQPHAAITTKIPAMALPTGSGEGVAITGASLTLPFGVQSAWSEPHKLAVVQYPTTRTFALWPPGSITLSYENSSISVTSRSSSATAASEIDAVLGVSASVPSSYSALGAATNLPAGATVALPPGVYISNGSSSGKITISNSTTSSWSHPVALSPVNKGFVGTTTPSFQPNKVTAKSAQSPALMNGGWY